jgi:hypothetical protein
MALIAEMRTAALKGSPRAKSGLEEVKRFIASHPHATSGFGRDILPLKPRLNPSLRASFLGALRSAKDYVKGVLGTVPKLGPEHIDFASVALANRVQLLPKDGKPSLRVSTLGDALPPEERKAYAFGLQSFGTRGVPKSMNGPQLDAYLTGLVVGLAKAIQEVRLPATPVARLSTAASWELGE